MYTTVAFSFRGRSRRDLSINGRLLQRAPRASGLGNAFCPFVISGMF